MTSLKLTALLATAWLVGCSGPTTVGRATPPSSLDPVAAPAGGLAVQAPAEITDRTQPVKIHYAYRDLPKDSWLVLRLEGADEGAQSNWTGPLTAPVPLSGSGAGAFDWDSYSVGCAPNDFPRWCATGAGRFKIVAEVMDQPFTGLAMLLPEQRPVRRARAESDAFDLRGDKDYGEAMMTLKGAARRTLANSPVFADGEMVPSSPLFQDPPAYTKHWSGACGQFKALPPLQGTMKLCGTFMPETDGRPRELRTIRVVQNTVRWRPADPSLAGAGPAMRAALQTRFPNLSEASVPPKGSWRASGPLGTYYRADTRSWVATFHLQTRQDGRKSDQRSAQVLVDEQGRACLVEVVERGRFTRLGGDPALQCPQG